MTVQLLEQPEVIFLGGTRLRYRSDVVCGVLADRYFYGEEWSSRLVATGASGLTSRHHCAGIIVAAGVE